jgi:hypothetical protein
MKKSRSECGQGTPGKNVELSVLFFFFLFPLGVRLNPLYTVTAVWPVLTAPDDDHCEAIGVKRIGRGTEVLGEKLPLYTTNPT